MMLTKRERRALLAFADWYRGGNGAPDSCADVWEAIDLLPLFPYEPDHRDRIAESLALEELPRAATRAPRARRGKG